MAATMVMVPKNMEGNTIRQDACKIPCQYNASTTLQRHGKQPFKHDTIPSFDKLESALVMVVNETLMNPAKKSQRGFFKSGLRSPGADKQTLTWFRN